MRKMHNSGALGTYNRPFYYKWAPAYLPEDTSFHNTYEKLPLWKKQLISHRGKVSKKRKDMSIDLGLFVSTWVAFKDLVLTPTFLLMGIIYFSRRN